MYFDVISAKYVADYTIKITFENGETGLVDFYEYVEKGGIFLKFKDLEYFTQFTINPELGTIEWNKEIDIAPETLYSKAMNKSLPSWMTPDKTLQETK